MRSAPPAGPPSPPAARAWTATLAVVGALTALRIALLFLTPLELYPDEAQYWLWSRRLAWGYFSKPPMIAWLIAATTSVGGDGEAWVRLCAPLAHAVAALALQRAGARFYDGWAGFRAAAIYALMPGVQLSSLVVATDAPLLACVALTLWATGALWTAPPAGGRRAALGLGAALGLACLAKYAGLYVMAGFVAHALLDPAGRRRLWNAPRLAIAAVAFAVLLAPNLLWNAANHFQTVSHTVADASIGDAAPARGFDPRGPLGFLLGQFGVFGPVPMLLLIVGGIAAGVRRGFRHPADGLLLVQTLPPLVVVFAEAVAVRANANWAAAAYAAGSLLVGAWTGDRTGRRVLAAGLAAQALALAAFAAAVVSPRASHALGVDNSFKRARGWRQTAEAVRAGLKDAQTSGPVTALAVDDRFLFNALAYYGRDWVHAPGSPPLRMWVHEARAHNQAEAQAPLTPTLGGRVAFASLAWPVQSRWDFRHVMEQRTASTPLPGARPRDVQLFIGEGFAPRPRDPKSGLPTPP